MANIPIYPGSSSFCIGDTPFGFYDNDYQFQVDADKVTTFCARRLGYPLMEVELQDISFYTAFEEAVTTYGNEVYAYKLRDNLLSIEGAPTSSNLNTALITPNLSSVIRIAQQYGSEAGVGGNVTWRTGSIALTSSIQDYDLSAWATNNGITGGIEIKRIFHYAPPASSVYSDGYSYLGYGIADSSSAYPLPASIYLLTPVSFDMQVLQAIDWSNEVRRSAYSFQLINNNLRLFPIPNDIVNPNLNRIWFEYINVEDRINNSIVNAPSKITNVSNAGYSNPVYSQINSIGRSWIFEYTLALCKEMLGYVRGKYTTVPIPGDNVTLNQQDLLASSLNDREKLIERLRLYLDETSRKALLERKKEEGASARDELGNSPMQIYIG